MLSSDSVLATSPAQYHYFTYGLKICSEIECPELIECVSSPAPDVMVRLGDVPEQLASARQINPRIQVSDGVLLCSMQGTGRYLVRDGREIIVEPDPTAAPGDVRVLLLGTALGALLHQRGSLPLHCCAIAHNGGVYAFCGESGAGKSTLATALYRQGYELLTDDVGVVQRSPQGQWLFYPGVPRIKLWREALDHFDIGAETLERDWQRWDKFHWQPEGVCRSQPLPLAGVFFLSSTDDSSAPASLRDISPQMGVSMLLKNVYRAHFINAVGDMQNCFQQCAGIAGSVPLYEYVRPWSLTELQRSLAVLPICA